MIERGIGSTNLLERKHRLLDDEGIMNALERSWLKKKAKTRYHGMPENNNQEFDAAEAALGSINTTPSCEILEHPQLRNLKRPPREN